MSYTDTYTGLSFLTGLVTLALLCLTRRRSNARATLAATGIANAITVGLMGPMVVHMGSPLASAARLHFVNAYLHALPAFAAFLGALSWNRTVRTTPNPTDSVVLLAAYATLFCAIPHSTQGTKGTRKIKSSYGVNRPAAWLASAFVLNVCIVVLIHTVSVAP